MSSEETKVTAATPVVSEPKTIHEHYEAAKAEQSKADQVPETVKVDDTPPEKPAEDPDKPADQPNATGEAEDALLTTDEVAKLTPKERGLYEKAQKNYTLKTQKLAADRKEFDEWKPLIEALKTRPAEAMEQLATQLGMKLQKPAQDTPAETLPEEWSFLEPILSERDKRLEARIRAEIEPVKQAHEEAAVKAIADETASTVKAFAAKYPGWQKHEAAMLDIGKKFMPAAGAMTDFEYMEVLHKLATADQTEAEKTKKVVEKIEKAARSVEPNTSGLSEDRVVHALPPPDKRSIRDAYEAAKRGELWTK